MPERDRLALRRSTVAFIFQSFGLIPMLSAAENVGVPLRITGTPPQAREERVATMLLPIVGLAEHAAQRPDELSGGQQQRVAIARALAGRPELLIADEPTGQLDPETAGRSCACCSTVVRSEGITALVATHDEALIDLADSRAQAGRRPRPGRRPRHRNAHPRRDEHGGLPSSASSGVRCQGCGVSAGQNISTTHGPRSHTGPATAGPGSAAERAASATSTHRGRQIRAAEPGVTISSWAAGSRWPGSGA